MSVSTALVLKDRIIDAAHKPTVVQWFLSYIGNTNACLGVQVQGVMLTRVVRGWVTCSHSVFHCRPTQQAPAGISSCSHYQTMPIAWSQKFEPGLLVYKHWLFDNVGQLLYSEYHLQLLSRSNTLEDRPVEQVTQPLTTLSEHYPLNLYPQACICVTNVWVSKPTGLQWVCGQQSWYDPSTLEQLIRSSVRHPGNAPLTQTINDNVHISLPSQHSASTFGRLLMKNPTSDSLTVSTCKDYMNSTHGYWCSYVLIIAHISLWYPRPIVVMWCTEVCMRWLLADSRCCTCSTVKITCKGQN